MPDPYELWQTLERRRPAAARLAVLSSLPVRVSPSFLRLARLRLLEDCSTGNEADLWLSDLVEARSAAGFSYRSEIRTYLRQRLAADPSILERVWREVHLALLHWLTPKARLEEELTWRLLRDPGDPRIDEHWRSVLSEMEQGRNAEGVARWVRRALPELPVPAFDSDVANKVWIAAHLLLGDTSVLGDQPQRFLESGEFAFATRNLSRTRIQVGLTPEGLLVSPLQGIENGHEIDVPLTRPLWVQIEDPDGEARRVVTLPDNEPASLDFAEPELVLRLIDGSAYRIADPKRSAVDKFIRRTSAPRVQITYEMETDASTIKKVQLPFIVGVMADLRGHLAETPVPVADRKFVEIDRDNFDERMGAMAPSLELSVPIGFDDDVLRLSLDFNSLVDFEPEALARKLETALGLRPSGDPLFSGHVNNILHHEDFQRLEGSWRGLHYLVSHSETNELLKIKVLDISKAELAKTLKKYRGRNWDQSPIFKKLYEEEYGQLGGEPYGCLVGDYYFDHSPSDVELLGELSRICAAVHAPFLAGAAPSLLQMDGWNTLERPRDLAKIIQTPEYTAWSSLRQSEDARYLGLTLPRFLVRLPYGPETRPVEGFDFEEIVEAGDPSDFTWANSAYLMASNIHRAFSRYGWCSYIRGVETGGTIEDLPVYSFRTDDGGWDERCPTEIAITDRREAELAKLGFMPLVHRKGSDMAAFFGAQSLQKPAEYELPEATANAALVARLPYLFACSRFAQYVKCIVRDNVGAFKERSDMETWLNNWLRQYIIDLDLASASIAQKARHPLRAGYVSLEDSDEEAGVFIARLDLQPHYQLEGLTSTLRIVTKLQNV